MQIHPQAVRAVTWHIKVAVDGVSVGVERHGGRLGLPGTRSLLFPLVSLHNWARVGHQCCPSRRKWPKRSDCQ